VIDEAGAGLTIQCPKCGLELTVPPTPPHSTLPYSEVLYRKCKDLAYEQRVEDAIRVRREADVARAQEKGYQFSESFAIHGTVEGVAEPAKWAIKKSLQNLMPKEEQEVFGALVCCVLGVGGYDEVLTVTLGSNLSWPSFEAWFWQFKEAKFWPSEWKVYPAGSNESAVEFYEKNLSRPTDPLLATIHGFSLKARQVLLDGWLGRTEAARSRLNREDYDKVIDELASAGFATRRDVLPLAERLCLLPIAKVRELQRTHGVKGGRSKEQIAKNLLDSVAAEKLVAEIALADNGFWSDTYVKLDVGYRQVDRYWFEYARAKLLAGTLGDMITHYNRLKQFQVNQRMDGGWPFRMRTYISEQSPKCPFCANAAKTFDKMQAATLDAMPPFHPGCTCGVDECEE
jgi:hypothetical protein